MRFAFASTPSQRSPLALARRVPLVPVALLVLLAPSACGTDEGGGTDSPTNPTTAVTPGGPSATAPGDPSNVPTGVSPGPQVTTPPPGPGPDNTTPPVVGPTGVGPDQTGPMPTMPPPGPTGSNEPVGPDPSTTTPVDPGPMPSATGPDNPDPAPGPIEGQYEPCSGEPFPAVKLTPVLEDLDNPIDMVTQPGDSSIWYVVERGGRLLRFDMNDANPTGTELLSLNASTSAECGFFSVALHPNFDGMNEKRIYVSYMPTCPSMIFGAGGSSALDEYEIEGDTATFKQNIFSFDQPQGNHNGGNVMFGPDGYLYYGLGDGGGGNDTSTGHGSNGNGQDTNVPLGKILRYDVDNFDTPPPGNLTSDMVGGGSVDSRIYHYGVRNPWRWSFDKLTGDLYIGDVGENTWEEVNVAPADGGNKNFGWSAREGLDACAGCQGHTVNGLEATDPVYAYPTNPNPSPGAGFVGSVTGGFVYRGTKIPGMIGRYIFADYVRADFFALTYDGEGGSCDVVEDAIPNTSIPGQGLPSFAEDADGELYVINMTRGTILRIDPE